jgi:hypothetical protein
LSLDQSARRLLCATNYGNVHENCEITTITPQRKIQLLLLTRGGIDHYLWSTAVHVSSSDILGL